jgi:hypothetical protein
VSAFSGSRHLCEVPVSRSGRYAALPSRCELTGVTRAVTASRVTHRSPAGCREPDWRIVPEARKRREVERDRPGISPQPQRPDWPPAPKPPGAPPVDRFRELTKKSMASLFLH